MKTLKKRFGKEKPTRSGAVRLKARKIHDAASEGQLEELKHILAADPEQVELLDANSRTALHCAVAAGHKECVDCLLAWGSDVNAADRWDRTALYEAVLAADAPVVRLLLQAGAEAYAKYSHNQDQNALHIAVLTAGRATTKAALVSSDGKKEASLDSDHLAVVRELLNTKQYYADNYQLLFAADASGRTPLTDAKESYKAAKRRLGIDDKKKSRSRRERKRSGNDEHDGTQSAVIDPIEVTRAVKAKSNCEVQRKRPRDKLFASTGMPNRRNLAERHLLQSLRQAKAQHTLSTANTTLNVLLHGWNDVIKGWQTIEGELAKDLRQPTCLFAYNSLKDKVDIPSLALELHNFLITSIRKYPSVQNVNLICFSTGGLIVRTFLSTYYKKHYRRYINRLVMLAPANMGSPFAKMGKEKIGKMWVGQKKLTSLFESGQQLLTSLEPASPFLWELTHKDAFAPAEEQIFAPGEILTTVIQGTRHYPKGIVSAVTRGCMRGTDGTVTVSGGSMRLTKLELNYADQAAASALDKSTLVTTSTTEVALRHHPAHTHRSLIDSLTAKGDVFFLVKHALLVTAPQFEDYRAQLEAVNETVYSESHSPGDLMVFRYEGNARPITRVEVLVHPDHHNVKYGCGIAPYMTPLRSKNIVNGITSKFGQPEYHSRSRNMFYQIVDTSLVAEEMLELKRQRPGEDVALALCLKGHCGGRVLASTSWEKPFPHVKPTETLLISMSPLEDLELRGEDDDLADEITREITRRGSLMNMRSFRILQKLKQDDSIDVTIQQIGPSGVMQMIEQTIRDKIQRELLKLLMERVDELSAESRVTVIVSLLQYFHLSQCKETAAFVLASCTEEILAEVKELLDVGEDSAKVSLHKMVFCLLGTVPLDLLDKWEEAKRFLIGVNEKNEKLLNLTALVQEHISKASAALVPEEGDDPLLKLVIVVADTLVATQADTRYPMGDLFPGAASFLEETGSADGVHFALVCEQQLPLSITAVPYARLNYSRSDRMPDGDVAEAMTTVYKEYLSLYPECHFVVMANGGGAAARFVDGVKAAHDSPSEAKLDIILFRDLGPCNSAFYNTSENRPTTSGLARAFFTPIGAAVVLYERGVLMQQHLVAVATATVEKMETMMAELSIDRWADVLKDLGSLQQQITSAMNSRRKTSNLQSLSALFRIADKFQLLMDEKTRLTHTLAHTA